MAKRTNLNRGEKALLLWCSFFVVIVLAIAFWWQDINATPRVTIPPPAAMPTLNARDYFIKAGNALALQVKAVRGSHALSIGDMVKMIEDGQSPGTGAGIAAFDTQHHEPAAKPVPSAEELHEWLRANAPAMAMLRQGFPYEYREPPCRSLNTSYPHYAKYREMARCLYIYAYLQRRQGDWNGAMLDCLDGLDFGERIPHGGVLISMLVGIAVQAIVREQTWPAIDHLDSTQARAATRRMEAIMRHHTAFVDVLREEEWCWQAGLLEIFREPNLRKGLMQLQAMNGKPQSFTTTFFAYTISKKQIMDEVTNFFNGMIANARLPYALRKTPPLPKDPITESFLEVYPHANIIDTYGETQNCLLLVSLALRAYELEHGHYPDSLTALTPSYLSKLPDDPFAASGTLCYRRTGKSYLLYSVGPDGKDDHGTPCAGGRAAKKGAQFHAVDEKSIGDIVAGVNVR